MVAQFRARSAAVVVVLCILLIGSVPAGRDPRAAAPPAAAAELTAGLPVSGLGLVVRDPFYEWDLASNTMQTALLDRMGRDLAAAGVVWIRTEIHLSGLGDDYVTDLAKYDYLINVVAPANGLKVLALLSFGLLRDVDPLDMTLVNNVTDWSQGIHAATCGSNAAFNISRNWYMQRWMTRAIAVTERYGARIHAYEILNEQNRTPYQNSSGLPIQPDCAARLQTEFYRRFKETYSSDSDRARRAATPVMIGGLHPAGSNGSHSWGSTDTDYLAAYYLSPAFQGFFTLPAAGSTTARAAFPNDALAYHPYPEEITPRLRSLSTDIAKIRTRLSQIRSALTSIGVGDLPLWITEIGYNIAYGSGTAAGQAAFLRAMLAELTITPGIATMFWFKYEDFPGNQLWGVVSVPFDLAGNDGCAVDQPGGACYRPQRLSAQDYRPSYFVLQDFSGMQIRQLLPLVTR
jgi:hypothetical protein